MAGSSVAAITSVVTPLAVPQSPTDLAVELGNGEVTVSWMAPVDSGGTALTGFTVTAVPGSASCTAAAGDTSCVVNGLTKGSTYTFEVVAENSVGDSLPATIDATVPTRPDAPEIVSVVPGDGSLEVTWAPSVSDGGAPITLYRVTAAAGGVNTTCEGLSTDTTCTVTGLQNGVVYSVYVRAINVAGISAIADFEVATPVAAPPVTRTRFDFDGDGKADVAVFRDGAWFVQSSSGGTPVASWGTAGDVLVPADYDGDGKTDFAVFRDGVVVRAVVVDGCDVGDVLGCWYRCAGAGGL